jgi:hypothetical protein
MGMTFTTRAAPPNFAFFILHFAFLILHSLSSLAKKIFDIFPGEGFDEGGVVGDELFRQQTFLFLQLKNFVFDGVFTDHAVGENVFCLTNTVRTVNGLLLHSWVPPGVDNVYIVRSGKVKTDTPCFQ